MASPAPSVTDAASRAPASRAPRGQAPPVVSGGLPGLGHTIEFTRDTLGLLFRARWELGDVAELRVLHKRFVLMTGPEASEAFFRAPDEQLSPSDAYKLMVPVFGKDVVYDAPPDKLREQFQMLMPALRDKRMRGYGEVIEQEVHRALESWGDRGELDLVDFCAVLTNFTSSHCLLGREFREEMTDEFARVYHDLEKGVTPIGYISPHLPLPAFRARDKARKRLMEMIGEIIARRRRTGHEGQDFLQTLMDARYADGTALTEHEITGMLLAAMFAGHHTSSVTTAWTLLELLRKPEYLHRCVEEVEQVFGALENAPKGEAGYPQTVSYHGLREIPHVEWAIKEALRLHPPLFMLLRAVKQDLAYGGYHIPRGCFVVTSPTVSHRISSIYTRPDEFDPERFGPGREEDKRGFTFLSFGAGRHKCLGNAFALLQVKTIFAILLRRYRFELTSDPIEPDLQGLVVGPRRPCRVRYERRS